MKNAWMRVLKVTLTSKKLKKKIVFGENEDSNKPDLNIDVAGTKYMSTLKDECIIKISNLTYSEIVRIIDGEFFDVQVEAGYKSSGSRVFFDGGVLYISNSLDDERTNTVIILCASKLIARYGQARLKLTLNSGINLYSAVKYLCKASGISTANISQQLKKTLLKETSSSTDSVATWINEFCQDNSNYVVNSDYSTGSVLSICDSNKSNLRVIDLTSSLSMLVGGYPQLTDQGLEFSIMPTFNFMCADVVKLDNSIISLPTNSMKEVQKNYGYFLDKNNLYMIFEMNYHFQNRGSDFSIGIKAKSRSLISNYVGK